MREYRAKFASLFSAIERRGYEEAGQGPLTVAEALPEPMEEAPDLAWGPSAAQHAAQAAPQRRASRLDELLAFLAVRRLAPSLQPR